MDYKDSRSTMSRSSSSSQLGSLLQCGVVSDVQDDMSDLDREAVGPRDTRSLQASVRRLARVAITGRGGTPVYHQCSLSNCEVLQPAGRWKYRFSDKNLKLSPTRFVESELRIGSVVIDIFRRSHVVTLFNYDREANSLTITIAEVGANQLAVIAVLFPVSRGFCRAAGLAEPRDSASLEHVIHVLEEWAPAAKFMFWSVGIPSTIMSEMLFTNIVSLPGVEREAESGRF